MKGAHRYNFDKVLVAGTKLLIGTKSTDRQPQVLVLNSRLDKCHDQHLIEVRSNLSDNISDPNCSKCCLQVDIPEFKRRSSVRPLYNDDSKEHLCFATCQARRSVDIELSSKTQLSGNLVILALTRSQNQNNEHIPTIKCNSENSWPFLKFEPQLNINNDAFGLNLLKKHTSSYSRFSSNQIPSITINSLEINFDLKARKEIVSLVVQSNRYRKYQQIVLKETLLVNEFDCWEETTATTTAHHTKRPIGKFHLLTLINLEAAPRNQSRSENSNVIASAMDIPPESSIDHPTPRITTTTIISQSKRAINSTEPTINTKTVSSITPPPLLITTKSSPLPENTTNFANKQKNGGYNSSEVVFINQNTTSISQRMDTSSIIANQDQPTNKPAVVWYTTMQPANNNMASNKKVVEQKLSNQMISNRTIMSYPFISEIDSIKLQLKSSSFLAFTVWSSFVVLTYTLCLLVYLKTRRHFRASNNSRKEEGAETSTQTRHEKRTGGIIKASSSSSNKSSQNKGEILNISEPFNLQMPSETRVRLETMLGNYSATNESGQQQQQQQSSSPLISKVSWKDELIGTETEVNKIDLNSPISLQNKYVSGQHCHEFQERHEFFDEESIIDSEIDISNQTLSYPTEYTRYTDYYSDYHDNIGISTRDYHHNHYQQQQQQPLRFAYAGTINVVRALRQAATLAKSRFRNPRYRPNLNVIPESDLEYLQSSPLSMKQQQQQQEQPLDRGQKGAPEIFVQDFTATSHNRLQLQKLAMPNNCHADCILPDQINSLVQDAMSIECSHLLNDRTYYQRHYDNHQATGTLFSKPNDSLPLESQWEQQVSRSRILRRVVKQEHENPYESHNGGGGVSAAEQN